MAARSEHTSTQLVPLLLKLDVRHRWGRGAVSMAEGPAAGLKLVDELADVPQLAATTSSPPLEPTSSAGSPATPKPRPHTALSHARTDPERRYLTHRLTEALEQS
jgi:hypothetical protein